MTSESKLLRTKTQTPPPLRRILSHLYRL